MTEKKKILVICQHFWPEAFRINDICDFLVDKDCEVDVLCGIPNYPKGQFFKGYSYTENRKQTHNGISIQRAFEIPRGNNTNAKIFLNYISFPIASLFHIPSLLGKKYDKIFIYQLSPIMMAITGIIIGKIKRTETIMYVLDLWPENLFSVLPIQNPLLKQLITSISHWHYRHVDKLVVLSEQMQRKVIEISKKRSKEVAVLPQACEKIYETYIEDKTLKKRFNKGFNIVFTGNISPAQSFNTILAAAQILKKKQLDINWIIVGDGMSREWLKEEVSKANLNNSFYFEGQKPVQDIPHYTTIADALVGCLTKSELLEATIPAKVMSYIAAGRPIILAMDGEVQKLINNKIKCGYAGEAGNVQALANNIQKLYALSPEKRKKMGERGRKYHFKHFERNLILNKLYAFIFT